MTTTTEKYEACAEMLKEVLVQHVPAKMTLFKNAAPLDPKQCAIYASACGLAESAIAFAVLSEGFDFDAEKVREQAKDPRWVADKSREVLAQIFRVSAALDDSR